MDWVDYYKNNNFVDKYLLEVRKLFGKNTIFINNKIQKSTEFPNFRFHYFDFRFDIIEFTKIWELCDRIPSFSFIDTKIDELIIPSPIESFVSDIYCKKLILPESLKVLDLWYDYDNSLEFNIPYNIKNIKMRYANILNKSFINLFPLNGSFRFIHCKLNNIELNIVLHQYYNKCFNNNIKNICTYE